jgi:hypothetical protein
MKEVPRNEEVAAGDRALDFVTLVPAPGSERIDANVLPPVAVHCRRAEPRPICFRVQLLWGMEMAAADLERPVRT